MSKKKGSKGAPAKRPEGKVIPLSFRDQWNPISNIRSLLFFIVKEVLDEQLMRDALDKLIREHIPILGARIDASGPDGGLEYHLPHEFPEGYKLFEWSSKVVDKTFAEANVLPQVGKLDKIATFFPSIPEMEAQWTPEVWPRERKDEEPDCAILLVHITHYKDATVVCTNLPHAVSDQKGYASLIEAWIEVMKGREPAKFMELRDDELQGADLPISELKKKEPKGVYRITNKKERAKVALGFALDVIPQPKETRRTLLFSDAMVKNLRDKFNAEIKEKEGEGAMTLTNGDVITAVLIKFGHLARQKPKMVTLSAAINLRGRHPDLPESKPYLFNAVTYSTARFPVSKETRLVDLAKHNRSSTLEAITPPHMDRALAVLKEMSRRKYMIHICEPMELSFALTNWCGAWRNIDFSAAVKGKGEKAANGHGEMNGHAVNGDGAINGNGVADEPTPNGNGVANGETSGDATGNGVANGGGSMSVEEVATPPEPAVPGAAPMVLGHSLERGQPLQRFNCQVMCKADGGYWVDFSCGHKTLGMIEQLLERDPGLETL